MNGIDQAQTSAPKTPTRAQWQGGSLTHFLLPILTDILIPSHNIHSFSQFTHSSWKSFLSPFS